MAVNTAMTRFDDIVDNRLGNIQVRCELVLSQFNALEDVVQEHSAAYLDLYVPSPTHIHWEKRARTAFLRALPQTCREYFLAEIVDPYHKVEHAYEGVMLVTDEVLDMLYGSIHTFRKDVFLLFEKKILDGIEAKDADEKKLLIRKYLRGYRRRSLYPDRFSNKYSMLLELCTNPPLDCELTVDLLNTFCDTSNKKIGVFNQVPNVGCLETLILQAKEMRFDFWGLWTGRGVLPLHFDFISYFSFRNLNQEYSRILLKYGFPYVTGVAKYLRRCVRLLNTRFEGHYLMRSIDVFYQQAESKFRTRMMLIMDTFVIFGNFESSADVDDRIQTLVYLTRSLPHPYVTPTELYRTMMGAVVQDFQPQLQAIVFNYASSDVFDDDINTPMPRRLEHLCRVAIRQILAAKFMLLDGIQKLPISGQLKRYMELES